MWEAEHSVEADVTAAAIWEVWTDVEHWGEWNSDIAGIEIDGPFEVGSTITMTLGDGNAVMLRLAEVTPGEAFVDVADMGGALITTTHRIESLGEDRVRVVFRTEIDSPAAAEMGPKIGPAITDDFPETIAALIARAGG
jgi:hypothetical protein